MSCSKWIKPPSCKTQVDNLRDDVRRVLREESVPITGGIGTQARGVQLRVANPDDRAKVLPRLRQLQQQTGSVLLGGGGAGSLDVKDSPDGLIQFTVTDAGIADKVRRAVDQSIEVLRRRVDALGTTEPNIQRQGADRILVQVPGLQDPEQAQGNSWHDRETRIPPCRRAGRQPGRHRTVGPDVEATRQAARREARHGAGRGLDRCAARLRPAHQRARRQFPLQYSRRAEVRPTSRRRTSANRSPSSSTTR